MSRLPEDERVVLFAACKRGMQSLLDNLAPEYYSDEVAELEKDAPAMEDLETEKVEYEPQEEYETSETEESVTPRMALELPEPPTLDSESSPLDPFTYLQNLHAQPPKDPPEGVHEEKLDNLPAEEIFPIAPGAEIATELYETWAAAMRAIREQMRISYSTFLAGAELAGCEIDGHSCRLRLQLPEEKRNIKRNGVIYPRFASAVEAILAEHFQTERAELQLL